MKKLIVLCVILVLGVASAYADPYVAEIAAGGLTLGKERSVLMEKERLLIREDLVHVDYEFRNTGKKAVSTEVAFPIPSSYGRYWGSWDFKASVDGKPISVQKEVKASAGVGVNYYWHQEFPAGKIVSIGIEYNPSEGGEHWMLSLDDVKLKMDDGCFSDDAAVINFKKKHPDGFITASWVSFILTTANTWQTPIKDFELIVQGEKGDDNLVTFCWDGKVEKIGDGKVRAHKKNFVPTDELKVYFMRFKVPGAKADS